MKKIKNLFKSKKIKELFDNKKTRNIIIISFIILIIVLTIIFISINKVEEKDKNTTTYDNIATMVKDKDTFLIYFYNSKSKNKYNKEIKEYLDKEKITYFNYNSVLINRNEYNKFLKLISIDKNLFGTPALIYIKNGKMYANIINIDSKKNVKKFIDNYDLYTVK